MKKIITDNQINKSVLYKGTEYPNLSFMGGEYLIFLVKKSENFARAIYLITNFLSDSEPIKWKLRTIATELIDKIMSFIREEKNKANDHRYKTYFLGYLSTLISLLNVGGESGAISEANMLLLKREITTFFPVFEYKIFTIRAVENDTIPVVKSVPAKKSGKTRGRPRGSTKKMSVIEKKSAENVLYNSNGQEKKLFRIKSSLSKKAKETRTKERLERQKVIIEIIKDKKKMTIKELVSVIKDSGEKKIQRDVLDLVDRGVLKTTGEKRWRTYSFAQSLLGV
jgi:hypothetical protein